MSMRYLLPLAIFFALVIFLGVGLKLDPREVPSPLIGKPAPRFSLPQLGDAGKVISDEALKGRVSLLNVWASWCASCRQEHPLLLELARQNAVAIYGLNYKDQREDALAWLARLGNPYQTSAFDVDGRVGIEWGVYGVPETFLIDRQGIIRHKQTGPLTEAIIREKLLPLIEQLQRQGQAS
jgi:cytochrome c biogenesis protein CcmG/thiol:disulfide interchange protein DsbE